MRERLLDYLLGELEPSERSAVDDALRLDAQLRRDLETLRRCLEPLEADTGHISPPEGLARRTCELVERRSYISPRDALAAPAGNWSLQDMVVAAAVLLAAALIFFPAINHSRYNAQLAGCQNHLRQIGFALGQYSEHHHGYFPYVPPQGHFAAAGIYAPTLLQAGYLRDKSVFLCPASSLPQSQRFHVPSFRELEVADGPQLQRFQRLMGGSYGYSLGHMADGHYRGTKNKGRETFAVMSDSPSLYLARHQSDNHGGSGQNVLFESGRVSFLTTCNAAGSHDNLFLNEDGFVAAGKHLNDAVIGSSFMPPNVDDMEGDPEAP